METVALSAKVEPGVGDRIERPDSQHGRVRERGARIAGGMRGRDGLTPGRRFAAAGLPRSSIQVRDESTPAAIIGRDSQGRVGAKDYSSAPLTEPDVRASHPALWIDIS